MTDALLTEEWRHLLASYHTLFVGFSGGLDSTVLLHRLASEPALVGKLQAVHVHHGLSVNAPAWQTHCQRFCDVLGVPLIVRQVEIEGRANIEERARVARYQVFSSLLSANDCLLLAHHCDDQAETLLLQLFRGAGMDGLAAMVAIKNLAKGVLARPFLHHSRQRLAAYIDQHQLAWVDDESNQNSDFSRNYLRHHIIPLLQEKWPSVSRNLARSAMHCQHAKTNLDALARIDCPQLDVSQDSLAIPPLRALSHARLANVLRVWLQNNDIRLPSANSLNRLINEVILVRPDATPLVQWGDTVVRRYQQTLYVLKNEAPLRLDCIEWPAFPAPLPLNESQYLLYASPDVQGLRVPAGCRVQVRFRQGGELFSWRGQTKQLKKLLQEWRVAPWLRDSIPLLYIDSDLVAVVGFAISDLYFSKESYNTYAVELRARV